MKYFLLIIAISLVVGCTESETENKPAAEEPVSGLINATELQHKTAAEMDVDPGFSIKWPGWCNKIRTRSIPSEFGSGTAVVKAQCSKSKDDGAIVFSYFELTDGSKEMKPEHVLENIKQMVDGQNLTIQRQSPIIRNEMEGIQVLCTGENEKRKWIEGYIGKGRMLIISAWRNDGTLFSDPEISAMFKSIEILK